MTRGPVLNDEFALVTELWQPKVVAEMNEHHFRIVWLEGEFVR